MKARQILLTYLFLSTAGFKRLLCSSLCILLLISTATAQQNWQDVRKQYLKFSNDTTKKDSAFIYAHKLKEISLKDYGKNSNEYFRSLNSIGYCQLLLKQYDNAGDTWLSLYKLLRNKNDTIFNNVKSSVLFNLYHRYYTDRRKQADSAFLFAGAYLKAQQNINGKISRTQLNEICDVAFYFERNFGKKYAKRIYDQSLEIRRQIWGVESVKITLQLDSVLNLYAPPGQLPSHRFEIYVTTDKPYTYKKLDTLSDNARSANQWWDYIKYSSAKKDQSLIEFPDSVSKYADALELLGTVYHDWGLDSVAVFCDKKALQVINTAQGSNNFDYADALYDIGYIYQDPNNFLNAKAYYQKALWVYAVKGKTSDQYANCLISLARLYSSASTTDIASENGYNTALAYFNEALLIKEQLFGKTSLEYAHTLYGLGGNYLEHAKLDDAEKTYTSCWKIYQLQYGDAVNVDKYSVSRQLYMVYGYKDVVSKQIPWLEKCVGMKQALKDTTSDGYIQDLSNLASRFWQTGDMVKARSVLKKVESLAVNFKNPSYGYGILLNMKLNLEENDRAAKDSLLNLAINNQRQLADTTTTDGLYTLASIYGSATYFYNADKKFDQAYKCSLAQIAYLKRARLDSQAIASYAYLNVADYFAYHANKRDSALVYYNKALAVMKTEIAKELLGYAKMQLNTACFYWYDNQVSVSEKLMNEACTRIKDQMLLNMAGLSESEKQHYNKELQESIQKYYNFHHSVFRNYGQFDTTAYNYIIQSKSLLLSTSNQLKNEIATAGDTSLQNKYTRLVNIKKQLAQAYSLNKEQQVARHLSVDELQKQASVLEEQLSAASAAYANFQQQNHLAFQDVRKALKPGEAVIDFIAFPYFNKIEFKDSVIYAAFIIKANSEKPIYIPLTNDVAIKPFIEDQGTVGRGIKMGGKKGDAGAFKKLYQLIWQPLAGNLNNIKRVYIATDGALNKVAFAALQDATGKYLMDTYELRFLLNTRDIVSPGHASLKQGKLTFALFGGATYDGISSATTDSLLGDRSLPRGLRGNSSWSYLPGTLSEVQSIGSKLKTQRWTVNTYTGQQASEKNFKRFDEPYAPSVIHIATHGFYFPLQKSANKTATEPDAYREAENPLMRAGLVFASANRSWLGNAVAEGEDDGILTAYELANMNLNNTQLVVLSACETGVGEIINGEGVYGLQRALRQAGVKKMIVSLWPVPDSETAEMMQLFYRSLTDSGNINESFRRAQAQMRSKYPAKPSLWAGFTLIE
ncbi:hypothetical protein BH09BAC6_BH09BAC6_09380 [soil metagenome]